MEAISNDIFSSAHREGVTTDVKTRVQSENSSSSLLEEKGTFVRARLGEEYFPWGDDQRLKQIYASDPSSSVDFCLISMVPVEDVTYLPSRKDRMAQQVCSPGRDHRLWTGNTSSPGVAYQGLERLASGWSTNLRRSPHRIGSLFELSGRGDTMRMLSTKPKDGDDSIHSSSEEKEPETTEEAPARPRSIEDFQHEEIVGPTVERDESDTANQLRTSLDQLTTFMTSLRTGFVLLGSVQLVAALWTSYSHGVGLILGLSQDLTFAMSFILAYLLRIFGSRVDFFSKIEGRSRIRILTLSLQANKMLTLFFFRSSFVVKAVAFCSLLALVADVWNSHLTTL